MLFDDLLQIVGQSVPCRAVHDDHQSRRRELRIDHDVELIDQVLAGRALGGGRRVPAIGDGIDVAAHQRVADHVEGNAERHRAELGQRDADGGARRAHAQAAEIPHRLDLLAGGEDRIGRQHVEAEHLHRRIVLVEQAFLVERHHRFGAGDRILEHERQFHHRGLREAAGMIALHAGRHFDSALFDHGEQLVRLAVAAERLQRHFDPSAGFLFDRLGERHQHLIIGRGVFGVDRAEAQHHIGGHCRRGKEGQETQ